MTKSLRTLAILLILLCAVAISPSRSAVFIPQCYSGIPYTPYPDSSWTYSHQCLQGSYVRYVYIDTLGKWHLTSSQILP